MQKGRKCIHHKLCRLPYSRPPSNLSAFRRLSRRKEVIQPHLPVRLPCYDFTLLTRRTFDVDPLHRLV